ncbi:hypothetical protein MKW92_049207 [Papaver armeniacum]|nr:hypothetical protein MKW92_049207 [Papaver armeniacum]
MSILPRLRCITIDVTGTLSWPLGDPCSPFSTWGKAVYPCFGHAAKMPNIIWWKTRFVYLAGYDYDEETFEKVFRHKYLTFGSPHFIQSSHSQPFLRWARTQGLIVGIVSNAEYLYQDVILHLRERETFPQRPEEVLHIGDSTRKDYIPATSLGLHGLLLDRFKTPDAKSLRD